MFAPDQSHGTFTPPASDDLQLFDLLGTKGYSDDVPLCQFAAWAEQAGLIGLLAQKGTASLDEIKAINNEGEHKGLLGGHYGDGHFKGRWMTQNQEGRLGGRYFAANDESGDGGFVGPWAEKCECHD